MTEIIYGLCETAILTPNDFEKEKLCHEKCYNEYNEYLEEK